MRRRRRWLRALLASFLIHAGWIAWAAQELGQLTFRWTLPTGVQSTPAIVAQFSEGDWDATMRKAAIDPLALQIPKSSQRTSPEDRLLTGGRLLSVDKQPHQPPDPTKRPPDDPAATRYSAPVPNTSLARSPFAAEREVSLSSVPRAQPAVEVQVEPIEPAVASTSSSASTSASGAEQVVPRAVENPPPIYPPEALARRLSGRVVVRVRLDDRGRVAEALIHRSSGESLLDEAALQAVRRWQFEVSQPARLREFALPVNFVLR